MNYMNLKTPNINNMKTLYSLSILAAILILTGCFDHLDREPVGLITSEQIDDEPSQSSIISSTNSIYHPLSNTLNLLGQWDWDGGLVVRNDFIVYDIAAGDMLKKWAPDGDQAWMDDVGDFSFTAINPAFNGVWSYNYEAISRANRAIETLENQEIIENVGMDNSLSDRLLGESYFLRAFNYFELVTNYGDVPLLTEPLENFSDAQETSTRMPEDLAWDLIREDLEKAANLLPVSKYSSESEPWRASLGAAIALQAKVALYNENYNDVLDYVNTLESHGFYDLNEHYFDAFAVDKQFQEDEVIFAYNHRSEANPGRGNGLGALIGWGFIAPSDDYIAAFDSDDPRLEYTIDIENRNPNKILGSTDGQFKGNDDGPGNKIYIRYADVLLWKAEAFIETGNIESGLEIVDQIRERARNTPNLDGSPVPEGALAGYSGNGLNAEEAKEALYKERRLELGFESQRFNDLKRWGIAEEVLSAMGKNFQDHHHLYPIPQREIDRSGGQIEQNPGY